ncbi:hypothetical protein ACFRJ1_11955 [Streptomyces sp. NPDC056773]|uniref:hypothetical protein n=1 Tax=unclassified Streptomyces TaxID=2593676 RepID=UPI0036A1D682
MSIPSNGIPVYAWLIIAVLASATVALVCALIELGLGGNARDATGTGGAVFLGGMALGIAVIGLLRG